jgi:acyl carrier protein
MTAPQIEAWLVKAIARSLRIDPKSIDAQTLFADFGIDSVAAVELSGDLEEWLGKKVAPTVVWDYPSIALLAAHLAD